MARQVVGGGRGIDAETERIGARRLAELLGSAGPAAAIRADAPGVADGEGAGVTDGERVAGGRPATIRPGPRRSLAGDAVGPVREFGRRHLGVIAVLLVVGLAGAGWGVLRARPVAEASPVLLTTATPAGSSDPLPSPSAPSGGTPPAAPGSPGATTPGSPPGAGSTPSAGEEGLLVHVLGAVRRPGVVALPPGARVRDAIEASGGLRSDARPGELNLAQPLNDGQQVVIGSSGRPGGEVRDPTAARPTGGAGGAGQAPGPGGSGGGGPPTVLDLNAADATQLDRLPGIGPVTAERILAWRSANGRFTRVEELQEVEGIGPKTYAQLAPYVRV